MARIFPDRTCLLDAPRLSSLDDRLKLRILWALTLALGALAAGETWTLVNFQPLGVDFLPLWTAGRMASSDPGHIYDFAAVTRAQHDARDLWFEQRTAGLQAAA